MVLVVGMFVDDRAIITQSFVQLMVVLFAIRVVAFV